MGVFPKLASAHLVIAIIVKTTATLPLFGSVLYPARSRGKPE
jgi:hypothetical protein